MPVDPFWVVETSNGAAIGRCEPAAGLTVVYQGVAATVDAVGDSSVILDDGRVIRSGNHPGSYARVLRSDLDSARDPDWPLGAADGEAQGLDAISFGPQTLRPVVFLGGDGFPQTFPAGANLTPPSISGDPFVGSTLAVVAGAWSNDGLEKTYQWNRNGEPIGGATGASYEQTVDDGAAEITVTESAGGKFATSESVHTFRWYVDGVNGDDGDDGLSPSTAFETFAAAKAAVGVLTDQKVALARGSHFREQLDGNLANTGTQVVAYGTGGRPIVDGSRAVTNSGWTKTGGYTNVYQKTVTHGTTTVPHGSDPLFSNTFHISMWADEDLLVGQFGSTTIATNLAALDAADSGFTAHLDGSANGDPRAGTGGTEYVYYVNLPGVTKDPSTAGLEISYAEQNYVAALATDGVWEGIEFRRAASKDMTGMADGVSGFARRVKDCLFRDPGCHARVLRASLFQGNYAYGRTDGRSKAVGGYGLNNFYGQTAGTYTPPITVRNDYVHRFAQGFGSHGVGAGSVHDTVTGSGLRADDCSNGVAYGLCENASVIEDVILDGCSSGLTLGDPGLTYRDVRYQSAESGVCTGMNVWGAGTRVENSAFNFVSSGANYFILNVEAQINDNANVHTAYLDRVSNKGGEVINSTRWLQLDLRVTSCVLGNLSTDPTTPSLSALIVENSFFSERKRTVAEMVAGGGAFDEDCLSAYQSAEQVVMVAAGDITVTNTTRTGTASEDSTAMVVNHTGGVDAVMGARIVNWDGAANDFDTLIPVTVNPNTSDGTVTLHDPAPGAFSNKLIHRLNYNKVVDFARPIRPRTAGDASFGPRYEVSDGSFECAAVQGPWMYSWTGDGSDAQNVRATDGVTPDATDRAIYETTGVIDTGFPVREGSVVTVTAVLDHAADVAWLNDDDPTGEDFLVLDPSSPLASLGMGRQVV